MRSGAYGTPTTCCRLLEPWVKLGVIACQPLPALLVCAVQRGFCAACTDPPTPVMTTVPATAVARSRRGRRMWLVSADRRASSGPRLPVHVLGGVAALATVADTLGAHPAAGLGLHLGLQRVDVLLQRRTLECLFDGERGRELVEQPAVMLEQHLGLGLGLLEQSTDAAVG